MVVGTEVVITILRLKGSQVRIGIEAPGSLVVRRGEVQGHGPRGGQGVRALPTACSR
ncbi:MAG: carbon storage regulator [Gemmataceae bacterium]